jgi:hypothetical protein
LWASTASSSLFAVAHLGHDGDVAFDLEQGGQRAEHHALIFGEHHPDGVAALLRGGIHLAQGPPVSAAGVFAAPSFSGRVMVSLVPASEFAS